MIEKICEKLTKKIQKEMPDVDEERAEVINYGLQIILGEVPKIFIMFFVAYVLGVLKLSLIAFLVLFPYRGASGGFHLHTHLGCILATCTMYCGTALLSKYLVLGEIAKYIVIGCELVFGLIMIKLYAPADTEDVPILQKSVRRKKQVISYLSFSIALIIALFIPNNTIANILIIGNLIQTISITKFAYKLTNNKYGFEVYDTSTDVV